MTEDYSRPWQEVFPEATSKSGRLKQSTSISNEVKTSIFIYRAKQVHGNRYDYSKTSYVAAKKRVLIICPTHGEYVQTPDDHLHGKGCSYCSTIKSGDLQRKTTEQFILEANNIHSSKYEYHTTVYESAHKNVVILCKMHGEFVQRAQHHLSGHGCPKCQGIEQNILYILTDTVHYKIGITNNLPVRMATISRDMGKPVRLVACSDLGKVGAREVERVLLNTFTNNPYKDLKFDGYTEWRQLTNNELELIITTYNMTRFNE